MSAPRRTWWHLESLGRKPGDYDIATSRLLYHPLRGFEVAAPAAAWHARYQQESMLRSADWERFADPRATTYTGYVTLQNEAEIYLDGLFQEIEDSGHDRRLAPPWLEVLAAVVPTLRYPCHGLQMAAAYVGQMAPAGRITITAMLQSADEIRRIQRLAWRLRLLQLSHPGFGQNSRQRWEQAPEWQPLRALIERLLATYDWGEAVVALNCAVKPAFDELCMVQFAARARAAGDDKLEALCSALMRDCRWQRQWTRALLAIAADDSREAAGRWFEAWLARSLDALEPLLPVIGAAAHGRARIETVCREGFAAGS